MSRPPKSPATDKRKATLRREILGGAFVIPLTLIVTLGAITYFLARTTQSEQALRTLETVTTIQEERVNAYIASGDSSLALIMSRRTMKTAIAFYQPTRDARFRAEAVRALYDGVSATPDFTSVTVYDSDLEPLLYAGSVESQPVIPSEFVEAAAQGVAHGRVVETDGEIPVNLVGMPITIDGRFVGVAVAGQSMGLLYDLTSDVAGLGRTGETVLVQKVDDKIVPITPIPLDIADEDTETRILEGDLLDLAVEGTESRSTDAVDYRGERVYVSTRYIDSSGWGMAVFQDAGEILSPLNTQGLVLG
ncbi:MAG: cache domain-containing protein, partial [Acidimicrobiia bacterium]